MRKSSRSISLALIGSALLLGGCQPAAEENGNEWTDDKDVAQTDNGNANVNDSEWGEGEAVAPIGENATAEGVATGNEQYHHGGGMGRAASGIGGAMIGSQIGRSLGRGMGGNPGYGNGNGGGNGGMAASPSSRGGFGSSAGGFGASGGASASS